MREESRLEESRLNEAEESEEERGGGEAQDGGIPVGFHHRVFFVMRKT